jgi:toxin ParE1/3/4
VRVRWIAAARQDRAEIIAYIRTQNPRAAVRMNQLFRDAAARLMRQPQLGRPGKLPGTRELMPHQSSRLVYEIEGGTVWIPTVVHTARQWPPPEWQRSLDPKR